MESPKELERYQEEAAVVTFAPLMEKHNLPDCEVVS